MVKRTLIALSLLAILAGGLAPAARADGPGEASELETFFDGLLAAEMQARHLPGATVAVVKGGAVLFAKGYGYADVERQTPVDPARTLFHAGSVSKLVTWTAVMQLVEAGKLDLDADVNTYLKGFRIPATYPQPITLAHLMAHTAGFEDQGLGVFVAQAEDLTPLDEYLATHIPARVRAPGELSAYSNYGASLAGLIVEQVSGEPFAQYVEEHIFAPLGMAHSSFRQPLPAGLAGDLAAGYHYRGGAYQLGMAEWCQSVPAGALSTTANDMAAFMIAHLQGGRFGDARILQEATVQEMHAQHFSHDPRVSGYAHGFMELHLNGQRLLAHGGDTLLFHSLLVLLPERNVGLFVSFNGMGEGAGAVQARYELLQAFLDRYYPANKPLAPQPPEGSAQRAGRLAGQYQAARSNWTTIERLLGLMQQVTVRATPDGALQITGAEPQPARYVEVEPLVYRNVANQDLLCFRTDGQGQTTLMFAGNNPTTAFIKLPWYAGMPFQAALLGASLLLFASMLLLPVGLRLARRSARIPALARVARGLAWAMSALYVAFVACLVVAAGALQQAPFGVPPLVRALFVLPVMAGVLALAVATLAAFSWAGQANGSGRPWWGLAGRLHYTLVAAAGIAMVWWAAYWNLLGFRF